MYNYSHYIFIVILINHDILCREYGHYHLYVKGILLLSFYRDCNKLRYFIWDYIHYDLYF